MFRLYNIEVFFREQIGEREMSEMRPGFHAAADRWHESVFEHVEHLFPVPGTRLAHALVVWLCVADAKTPPVPEVPDDAGIVGNVDVS